MTRSRLQSLRATNPTVRAYHGPIIGVTHHCGATVRWRIVGEGVADGDECYLLDMGDGDYGWTPTKGMEIQGVDDGW